MTFIAERTSARLAGVLLGFPLGAGLSLLFFGIEQGALFAVKSALWGIPGILASLTFALAYLAGIKYFTQEKSICIILSTLIGVAGFFVATLIIYRFMPESSWLNIPLTVIGVFGFALLFKKLPIHIVSHTTPVTPLILGSRAGFAALVVLLITSAAHHIGPQWSGLFTTFPVTLLPVIVILHYHYGVDIVFTLLRELPFGLLAIIVFDFAVAKSLPLLGVGVGICISYGIALLYLLLYELKIRKTLARWFLSLD